MKRVIVALIFFILALTICISGYLICIIKLNDINEDIGNAMYIADSENKEQLEETTDCIIKKWNNYKRTIALFVPHGDIENIDENIKILSFYVENDEYIEYKEACNKSIISSQQAIDSQKVCADNIF